jgi:TRAP-type uncharacterized transport system substrate-binding protein
MRISRSIELHMQGDWGIANLHRILGWLSAALGARVEPDSRFAIWNGRGGTDAAVNLLDGRMDMTMFVPACMGRALIESDLILKSPRKDQLRALGTMPQTDRLVIAIDASLGLRSLAEIRAAKPPLRVAAAFDDGTNMVGLATTRLLRAADMARETIQEWGGSFLDGEAPWDTIDHAIKGRANAVIFEAIMTPYWKTLTATRPYNFIPIDDAVLDRIEREDLLPRAVVPAGRFDGPSPAFSTLDFSDFLLLCRDDLSDEIAYLVAECLCETTEIIESQYRHLAPDDSPVTYPLEPRKIARTSVKLHPGAERYYREKNLL